MTASPMLPRATLSEGHPGTPAYRAARAVVENVRRVVRGRDGSVELVATALLAGGHVLIEDVPGSGKTTLARAFARSLGGTFHRVQGTADLLPADITGSGVWDPDQRAFRFVAGPVFAHVLLVDELNRLAPRTQSAFLEAMEEAAVTADGRRHALPDPFFVIATQNPMEQWGTFPLPEGQLDRFAVSLRLGVLAPAAERQVVREQLTGPTVDLLEPVIEVADLVELRAHARTIHVSEPVLDHALAIVQATRYDARVLLGASPRAALSLVRCAQARALLCGRDFVVPDDVKLLAAPVLAHRLTLQGDAGRGPAQALVAEIVSRTAVPVGT
ncbi:MAG: AAA family ATPase [Actinomycetes bacterium]